MNPDRFGTRAICSYCDSEEVYADKYDHLWCAECGSHVGWTDGGVNFLMLRIPRWPGDWQGGDGDLWSGWMNVWADRVPQKGYEAQG